MTDRNHIVIEAKRATVNLELDGRAIICREDKRILGRHPIQRLDRMTLRGPISLHTALLACLSANGVPVICLDADGDIAAMIPPRFSKNSGIGTMLNRFAPETLKDITEDWQRAELSRHAKALRFEDPAAVARAGWRSGELLLRRTLPKMTKSLRTRIFNETSSFCRLLSMRVLSDAYIPQRWLGSGSQFDPNLNETFSIIAFWRLLRFAVLPRFQGKIQRALVLDDMSWGRQTARLAETSRNQLHAALQRDVHRYHLHLIDMQRTDIWRG